MPIEVMSSSAMQPMSIEEELMFFEDATDTVPVGRTSVNREPHFALAMTRKTSMQSDMLSTDAGSEDGEKSNSNESFENLDTVLANAAPYNPLLPSIGSAGHATGNCHRCGFFPKGRCVNGYNCQFCHFGHIRQRKPKTAKSKNAEGNSKEETKPASSKMQPPPGVFHQTPGATPAAAPQPKSPPGFFGRPPPGLEEVSRNANTSTAAQAPTSLPLPPGSWDTSKPTKREPVTLSLDEGVPKDLPEPLHEIAALKLPTKQYPSRDPGHCVAGLDPNLPAKKLVTSFLLSY
eukprot:gnl/MRDRNA2_/MRDRNA2_28058_c0_seq1.p1 gnl/MRDRNA2_/MRDRNA2_28058_c0~~gnl/MRDRNA2_/MRDRNA2_28058_c0_seq1.p1  ORF type:complete len:290 (+),score=60.67 gnl/MRDRNA2_/MRDRNA2_28058_c0_seq1:96-965(+)